MSADTTEQQLAALRPQLLRFARLQLRSAAAAEDAVQDALLAALANVEGYAGTASLKTWVFAILRHKIIDDIRRRGRDREETLERDVDTSFIDEQFDESGHWAERPSDWGDPAATLEQKHFWTVFELCLNNLAAKPGRAFMMRELPPGEQLSLRLHLMLCAGCRRVDRQLDVLREACRRFSSGEARDL